MICPNIRAKHASEKHSSAKDDFVRNALDSKTHNKVNIQYLSKWQKAQGLDLVKLTVLID